MDGAGKEMVLPSSCFFSWCGASGRSLVGANTVSRSFIHSFIRSFPRQLNTCTGGVPVAAKWNQRGKERQRERLEFNIPVVVGAFDEYYTGDRHQRETTDDRGKRNGRVTEKRFIS